MAMTTGLLSNVLQKLLDARLYKFIVLLIGSSTRWKWHSELNKLPRGVTYPYGPSWTRWLPIWLCSLNGIFLSHYPLAEKTWRQPIKKWPTRTYRKIEIRPSWHNETFSLDIGQTSLKVPPMPDDGNIAHLPCFEKSQHVVSIPWSKKTSLPFLTQEGLEVCVSVVVMLGHTRSIDWGERLLVVVQILIIPIPLGYHISTS